MKKILVALLVIVLPVSYIAAQQTETGTRMSPKELNSYYLQKKRTNSTVAWLMVGGGVGMIVAGTAINVGDGLEHLLSDNYDENKGMWLVYAGGATALASIPFFVAAHNNKKLAATVGLNIQTLPANMLAGSSRRYTAVAFRVSF